MPEDAIAGALIDLDGTVYLGDELLPGTREAIQRLREGGVPVLFVSNKAIDRRRTFSEKLTDLGVPAVESDVINSASIAASYLADAHPTDPVFVVGEPPLREELRQRDLHVTHDPAETAVVLASMDREFNYETLTAALHAVDEDTTFLATNPDRTCPTPEGPIPDCGAIVGAIEGATGRGLDRVLGKPSQVTVEAAADALGVPLSRCLMIGDRIETDVRMGARAGMTTVLVLSGVADRETLAATEVRPDHVIESLADLDQLLDG